MVSRRNQELRRYLRAQRRLLAESRGNATLEEIGKCFLQDLAGLSDFEAGALWEPGARERKPGLIAAWRGEGMDEDAFAAALEQRSAGLALPVPSGSPAEALAVAELYSSDATGSAGTDEALAALCDQLAYLIDQRRLRDSARAATEFRSAALVSSPDCIIGMDQRGRVTEFNDSAERVFGYRRSEVLGRELAELIIPERLRERHRQGLRRYLATRKAVLLGRRFELPAIRRDGSVVPIELTVTCSDSDPLLFLGFLRDLSERGEAERTRHHLAQVVQGTQEAVLSKDLDGIVTTWNRGAEELYGYTEADAVGRHISFLAPADRRNEPEEILERVRDGKRLETYETERIRKDRARIDVALTVSPIEEPLLGVVGASVIARDITTERRRHRAQEFLIGATRILDSSLDPEQTARTIVAAAVPELAELCVIDFVRPDGRIGESIVAGADPDAARRLEEIRRASPLDPDGEHPVAQVLQAEQPMVWRDLTSLGVVSQIAQNDDHRRLMSDAGYRSAAVVALKARGKTIGALSLLHASTDLRYDTADLQLLAELGDRAAMALDNARLYAERDQVATNLQRGLRPPRPPEIEGLEISVAFQAAGRGIEIGGDFYDVLPTEDGCWILLGDVTGKGSAAAGVSVAVRHSVRGLTREIDHPRDVLARVNELLLAGTGLNDFATTQLVRMRREGDAWEAVLAAAGHPPAIHLVPAGPRLLGGGTVLGALQEASVECHEMTIEAGEALVLCTDGWLEVGDPAEHEEPSSFAAMVDSLSELGLDEMTEALRADALRRGRGELRDDLVVLALRPRAT